MHTKPTEHTRLLSAHRFFSLSLSKIATTSVQTMEMWNLAVTIFTVARMESQSKRERALEWLQKNVSSKL